MACKVIQGLRHVDLYLCRIVVFPSPFFKLKSPLRGQIDRRNCSLGTYRTCRSMVAMSGFLPSSIPVSSFVLPSDNLKIGTLVTYSSQHWGLSTGRQCQVKRI
jgi:hypothetical protein